MRLNPPTQYATDGNLRARQRLWASQQPPFDLVGWVLEIAGLDGTPSTVLDVGCGNGTYVTELRRRGHDAVGCDLSPGMLAAAQHPDLVNADVGALPFPDGRFDVVLAPHMLYHVADRTRAVHELRRVLRPGGTCVAVTNGRDHVRALREVVEAAVTVATPNWEMRNPSTHEFSLDNGADQMGVAFEHVDVVRPDVAPIHVTESSIVADYVASVEDHYAAQTSRPWADVVAAVEVAVRRQIDATGSFTVRGDVGAFVCR